MPISFLSSPYTHKDKSVVTERVIQTAKAAAWLLEQDIYVFSPILMGHSIVEVVTTFAGDWDFWQNYCKAFIDKSSVMYILKLDGWDESVGIKGEIDYANEIGVSVKNIKITDSGFEFEN